MATTRAELNADDGVKSGPDNTEKPRHIGASGADIELAAVATQEVGESKEVWYSKISVYLTLFFFSIALGSDS